LSDVSLHGGAALAAFRHEAFLYAGTSAFLQGAVPFIRAGLDAGEPVLVVVGAAKIRRLRESLGPDAERVSFADMAEVGRNPARIIPAWRDFLAGHGGDRPARGIGEPVDAGRTPDELLECQRHEALLNVAFAGGAPWRLLCPYDTSSLSSDALRLAHHSHRFVTDGHALEESFEYRGDRWAGAGDDRLPEPPGHPLELSFGPGPLEPLRRFVADQVVDVLSRPLLSDLLLAMSEVVSNSIVHGGGAGRLRLWTTDRSVVCEVRDRGWITEPLVGRTRPILDREHGRGLWMVNQLCDLVQLRSSAAGTVVRMHLHRPAQPRQPSSASA
jgi:anti-sigma regulatory factor (Ser/Thr protein kinase)